jgi:HSP20 family molecular chaperone IbpA
MRSRNLDSWAWGEALSLLEQADRLHRQFFRIGQAPASRWEPPVDVVETADAVRVTVALPGAVPDSVIVSLEPRSITVSALRPFPGSPGGARIHRVEIPYGRFERRIHLPQQLPEASLELVDRVLADGCLTLTFAKRGPVRGA